VLPQRFWGVFNMNSSPYTICAIIVYMGMMPDKLPVPLPMSPCCHAGHKAWAFGLGLERLAMVLFDIPDIRWVGV